MLTSRQTVFMILLSVLFTASPVLAMPIDPTNDRPAAIGLSGEPTLQSVLNANWGAGAVNAATDQHSTGKWSSSSALFPSTIPTMLAEFAGLKNENRFGIWSGTDTTSISHVDIFRGSANAGSAAGLLWQPDGLHIFGPSSVNAGTFSGIDPFNFGFYLRRIGGPTYYTVDQLNPGGIPMALAYNRPGTTDWVFGFEDKLNLDYDYNDMIVRIESIVPVPEPASVLLLGAGLTLLWIAGLVRQKRELARRPIK